MRRIFCWACTSFSASAINSSSIFSSIISLASYTRQLRLGESLSGTKLFLFLLQQHTQEQHLIDRQPKEIFAVAIKLLSLFRRLELADLFLDLFAFFGKLGH